jgi:beta-lactamase regulating signal transducer with metallopeptidase domain
VWLLAMAALVALPVLSVLLPAWRVLPEWASAAPAPTIRATNPPSLVAAEASAAGRTHEAMADETESAVAIVAQPVAVLPEGAPSSTTRDSSAPADRSWSWLTILPLVWAIGCCVLILRLLAARWILWNLERQSAIIGSSGPLPGSTDDPLLAALEAGCSHLGIRRAVTLLVHPDGTMPVVWGILRSRLVLPAAARNWSGEQLRSVLLHELAHIERRDPLAQLVTQFACALHWFNPLAWLAARRLGVERERACDDLVLASGVRPSDYAGHLLEVVTGLSSVRWARSCGLAMARTSSLEGRLVAVLGKNVNRRGVPAGLAASALAIAAGIAVPIAMFGAMKERPGDKEKPADKPKPADTTMQPNHEYAQELFAKWQASARTDGKIPGALIGQLAGAIDSYLKDYPKDKNVPALTALRPRLDASRDWNQADVVALLDDITAIRTTPVSRTKLALTFSEMRNFKRGDQLPVNLKTAAWGAPAANGLRAAWLLEPNAKEYALGTVLKSRVLFHNSGKAPVVFTTDVWHQGDEHEASDARGGDINIKSVRYTGITPTATYRLAPGEYCEVTGHGIAIGAGKYEEEFSTGSIGAVIEAKVGDEVTLTHTVDAASTGWTRPDDPKNAAELWKKNIAARVEREGPMPKAAANREQLIRRVTLDALGVTASAKEIAAFVGDNSADALAKLTARLQEKPRIEPWAGKLPTGKTIFRVGAADPNAARAPRTAHFPGRYVLGENVRLLVSQITTDAFDGSNVKRSNKARIAFLSADPKVASPHKPHEIALPDGIGAYGIVWQPGAGELWVMQKGLVRKYNFTDPARVKETRYEPGTIEDVPKPLRAALRKVFAVGPR